MENNLKSILKACEAFTNTMPAVFVDLEKFDHNIKQVLSSVEDSHLTIRVATKSIRVPDLIRRALDKGGPKFRGLMCYSPHEAEFLAEQGFDDLLIAYPRLRENDIAAFLRTHESGKLVYLVVDSEESCGAIYSAIQKSGKSEFFYSNPVNLIFELDVSARLLGGRLWIGARRSPLGKAEQLLSTIQNCLKKFKGIHFSGVMAYEGQVSSTTDSKISERLMRHIEKTRVAKRRKELFELFEKNNFKIELFNGAGTGCLHWAKQEADVLTEMAAGSAFYFPHLFEGASELDLKPSLYYALARCRSLELDNWATYQGGGFIASGAVGPSKAPKIIWPKNIKMHDLEGFGEVQTPVQFPVGQTPPDYVVLRAAKAGEIAERFNEFYLVDSRSGSDLTNLPTAKTYRGYGKCFH